MEFGGAEARMWKVGVEEVGVWRGVEAMGVADEGEGGGRDGWCRVWKMGVIECGGARSGRSLAIKKDRFTGLV